MNIPNTTPHAFISAQPAPRLILHRKAGATWRGRCTVLLSVAVLSACGGGAKATGVSSTASLIATAPAATPIPLAARVNGESITLAELDAGLVQLQDAQATMNANLATEEQHRQVLDHLVDETLLSQGAQQAGFSQTEDEFSIVLDEITVSLGGPDALANWQQRMGYTPELFEQALRRSVAAAWQRDRLSETVPERAEQVRARHILYIDPFEAESALEQVSSGGADFTALAFSHDPLTGGDLGWCPRGYLAVPAVEDALFGLQPGGVSLVTTEYGTALVYLAARESDRPLTLDARRVLQRRAIADWLTARRAKAQIELLVPVAEPASIAATGDPASVTYTAQAGDSFFSVAQQFGLSARELLAANPALMDSVAEGSTLNLPGRTGPGGMVIAARTIPGETLDSLARIYQAPVESLARLNRVISPAQLAVETGLALPVENQAPAARRIAPLQAGQSLLAYAAAQDINPWLLLRANQAATRRPLLAGEALFVPSSAGDPGPLPAVIRAFSLDPLPLVQGGTAVIRVQTDQPARLTGRLDGRELRFFEDGENSYVAIQGVHVMAEPGLIDFSLRAETAHGITPTFETMLLLADGEYEKDPSLSVDPKTIDPAVTEPEQNQIIALTAEATPEKYWDAPFGIPVDPFSCSRSPFGSRRSYNDGPYTFFHGGLDYGLCDSPNIYAPAPGVVIFTGLLTVRGNATIIDHGWGVYSGIWHQSEIDVAVGDRVAMGQLIGKIGDTGRVTGAHLHWEVWANGVQVNPMDWLARSFP